MLSTVLLALCLPLLCAALSSAGVAYALRHRVAIDPDFFPFAVLLVMLAFAGGGALGGIVAAWIVA